MNVISKFIVLGLFLAIWQSLFAQVTFDPPEWTLKYCPNALVSPHNPAIQFGVEYRFHPRQSWHSELGYVFNLNNSFDIERLDGVRALTEYRFFVGETKMSLFKNFYFALAARYVYSNSNRDGTFWRDRFTYQQRLNFKLQEHRLSLSVGLGVERQLFHKFSIGFGILMGGGVRFQKSSGIPEDSFYVNPGWFTLRIMEEGDFPWYTDVLLRLHIGYTLSYQQN